MRSEPRPCQRSGFFAFGAQLPGRAPPVCRLLGAFRDLDRKGRERDHHAKDRTQVCNAHRFSFD
ncbi:hypothetical protein SPHINGO361_70163 [Sphingomonas sp. EC-HK361]|nr:hypothetical protein SPHINGO361_70163 [Sphingomonas sp. EC-HK361]